jgi:asparagine synthetase B (glutamine-hydrolysing)
MPHSGVAVSASDAAADPLVLAPYIQITRAPHGLRVLGNPAVRVDHPWPRDPGSSDVYVEWRWDGTTLTAWNDWWGFHPLFYCATADSIAVATSIPPLLQLGAPSDLDDGAMAAFLRISHFLASDTPFTAIRALLPNSRLTWRACVLEIRSATRRPPAQPSSRASIIDGYITLFREAMKRRLPADGQRVIVPLSGGHDSRHLLLQLIEDGCAPTRTATVQRYPPEGNDDAQVAPLVAAAARIGNVVLPHEPQRVRAERRKNVMTSFCADRHVQMLPLVDYLQGRADVIYDGLGGDILSGSRLRESATVVSLLNAGRVGEAAQHLLNAHSDETALQAVLQPNARQRFGFDVARARLAEELRRHLDAPHPWGSYRLANRSARSTALLPFAMLARACRVMTPYIDRELANFLMTLPTSCLADGELHRDVIARMYPRYAHLRYENRTAPSGPAPAYYRRLCWDLARDALGRSVSPLVRRPFLASRLFKAAAAGVQPWIQVRRAIFLMQLEEVLDQSRGRRAA